ncbi:XdhC family protein [Pseudoxanthomonas sp. SL93]|uniref:XdhC family protein n=1 Tax=Pseudoxanthomonas sp. SL93 TaxID=2995142 RepID=UPI00226FA022|nr:XdhC family protein [Pseudoxanthomonas sp. SL93]WAC64031.1 XdhC family protein [Pseudoxanthomonas sp. SL93]
MDIQLTCGGRIEVFVRLVEPGSRWLACLAAARAGRHAVDVFTHLDTGAMAVGGDSWPSNLVHRCRYAPPIRLVLIGGDPITLAAALLAGHMGMEVVLWRHQGPADPPPQVPVTSYLAGSLQEGLDALKIDEFTAVYCLTHDLDLDVLVLQQALPSAAFCVGVLGSRSKREARIQALEARGVNRLSLTRLRSPAGLALGAKTSREIALSILAEVVLLSRRHNINLVGEVASEPILVAI